MNEHMVDRVSGILGPRFEMDYFSRIRGYVVFRGVEGEVSDEEMSRIIADLLGRGYFPRVQKRNGQVLIHVMPQAGTHKKSRLWINALLFVVTIISTMMAGATLLGKDYISDFWVIFAGWKYSFAVMLILTTHEMGHYWAARWHNMNVTLPYYIPLPIQGFHFGTLGAFIKIRSPIPNRIALLDVGVAGPLAGFVMSLIFLIVGYIQLPDLQGIIAEVEKIHPWDLRDNTINLILGKSLLFAFFNDTLGNGLLPMNEIYHFPFIFAGWIGLLVTAINLMPIGQLDGGHILYSLVGKKAWIFGVTAFALLIVLNLFLILQYFSFVWVLWIILIFLIIGFRHPPTLQDDIELNQERRITGWVCVAIFMLCFTPLPIYIG